MPCAGGGRHPDRREAGPSPESPELGGNGQGAAGAPTRRPARCLNLSTARTVGGPDPATTPAGLRGAQHRRRGLRRRSVSEGSRSPPSSRPLQRCAAARRYGAAIQCDELPSRFEAAQRRVGGVAGRTRPAHRRGDGQRHGSRSPAGSRSAKVARMPRTTGRAAPSSTPADAAASHRVRSARDAGCTARPSDGRLSLLMRPTCRYDSTPVTPATAATARSSSAASSSVFTSPWSRATWSSTIT